MPRFSGRLREVVAYKSRTREGVGGGGKESSENRSDTSTYSKRIYYMHFPSYNTSSARLSLKVACNSEWRRTFSEHGDQTMCQVVASKRLKTVKNYNAVKWSRSVIRGDLREVPTIEL